MILIGAIVVSMLSAAVWWISSSPTENTSHRIHTSPNRPRLGGPSVSISPTPLYRIALLPEPSTLGYPIGAQFEVLVENRLGKAVLDFQVREVPGCLKSISDPLRALFQVKGGACGLLVLSVDGVEVSTNIQAQDLIDDVLKDIE